MTWSTCAKCGSHSFQLVENEPSGSNFKLMFIQCSSCGAPIGVQDYYNTGALLQKQQKQIEAIEANINNLQYSLDVINNNIATIINALNALRR
jgi:hypothetical protein